MEDSHNISLCTATELSDLPYDPEESHQKFKIENITVINPQLLKIFYWQSLDIGG